MSNKLCSQSLIIYLRIQNKQDLLKSKLNHPPNFCPAGQIVSDLADGCQLCLNRKNCFTASDFSCPTAKCVTDLGYRPHIWNSGDSKQEIKVYKPQGHLCVKRATLQTLIPCEGISSVPHCLLPNSSNACDSPSTHPVSELC